MLLPIPSFLSECFFFLLHWLFRKLLTTQLLFFDVVDDYQNIYKYIKLNLIVVLTLILHVFLFFIHVSLGYLISQYTLRLLLFASFHHLGRSRFRSYRYFQNLSMSRTLHLHHHIYPDSQLFLCGGQWKKFCFCTRIWSRWDFLLFIGVIIVGGHLKIKDPKFYLFYFGQLQAVVWYHYIQCELIMSLWTLIKI